MFQHFCMRAPALSLVVAVPMAGCASVSPERPFAEVATTVEDRTGKRISWEGGPPSDPAARAAMAGLLSRPLTAVTAVQVALLNNRGLQATYADLGIAQAELVQAGLPRNPVVDGSITFSEDGATNLVFGGALKIIEIVRIPLKKRVARSQLEEAKLKVAAQVLGVAGETHLAFIEFQAQLQLIDLFSQVVRSTRASLEAAKSLREAGNITALEFETQNDEFVREKLGLAKAEAAAAVAREKLNVLMGLSGRATKWRSAKRLPDVPGRELGTGAVERRAIEKSLELAAARQKLITLAKTYRLTKAEAIIPDLEAGAEWERDDGEEEKGPIFEVEVPIFDWGRARKAKARMEIVRARDEYTALAVKIRSAARLARAKLLTARKTTRYYQQSVLPQSRKLVTGSQRQYNAMQLGVFQLIQAKRRQIQAGQQYVEALSDYWKARARFALLMQGKLPGEGGNGGARIAAAASGGGGAGGH
ncbi:MAG: TolC family protein [Methyloligellaceae bacterium]